MNVVFTGPAFDSSGRSVIRADLTYACIEKGYLVVQSGIQADTDILVASRLDTVKAKHAAIRGVKVYTYPEFIAQYLSGVPIKAGGVANKYTDVVDRDLLVPSFADYKTLEIADIL